MAKGAYIGVNNVAKKIKKGYVGVDGVARKIKKAYIGIGGGTVCREVEYIESNGTQYIDTKFIPNQDTRVVVEFETESANSDYRSVFAARTSSGNANSLGFYLSNNNVFTGFYGAATMFTYSGISYSGKHTVDWNKNVITLDGTTQTLTAQTYDSTCSLFLCAVNNAGTVFDKHFLQGKIYSCQIYDNGTLVRDFVPCVTNNNDVGLFDKVSEKFYGNAGTDVFAAGNETGNNYITSGVARPCWAGGEVVYYGAITPLPIKVSRLAATSVGDHVLFGGGFISDPTTLVTAYDTSFVQSRPFYLSWAVDELAATNNSTLAAFAGGGWTDDEGYAAYSSQVTACDKSLTRKTNSLSEKRSGLAATTVNEKMLFAGGYGENGDSSTVDAFDSSLTRSSAPALNRAAEGLAATTAGNYAIFAGGQYYPNTATATATAYDSSLTKVTITDLAQARRYHTATADGGYALFAGGTPNNVNNMLSSVEVYSSELTKLNSIDASIETMRGAATSVEGFALFGYGVLGTSYVGEGNAIVDVFDGSLTRTTLTAVTGRHSLAAASVNNIAMFGGGYASAQIGNSNVVEVFKVT